MPNEECKRKEREELVTSILGQCNLALAYGGNPILIIQEIYRLIGEYKYWEGVEPEKSGRYGILKELTEEDHKEIYDHVMKRSDEIVRGVDEE